MEIVSMLLVVIGYVGLLAAGIWFLIVAFKESPLWGLGCLFVPFVSLVFLVMHWADAKRPFFAQLISCVPLILGIAIAPSK